MKAPNLVDIEDAIDHASDFVDIHEYVVSEPRMLSISEVGEYDDLSSWVELGYGELSDDEASLVGFRGTEWASRASRWKRPEQIPPIIVVDTPSYTGVADGRGRINYVIGMGWKNIPVVFLSPQ